MEPHKFRDIPLPAVIKGWFNQTKRNAQRTVLLALSRTCAIATKNLSCTVKYMHNFLRKQGPIRSLKRSEVILSQQCSLAVPTTSTGMPAFNLPLMSVMTHNHNECATSTGSNCGNINAIVGCAPNATTSLCCQRHTQIVQ